MAIVSYLQQCGRVNYAAMFIGYDMLAAFTTKIKPLSKERPRTGKGGHVYTPTRTREYERAVRAAAISQLADDHKVPTGPVKLVVRTVNSVPVSWKSEDRVSALMGLIYPNKGDLDNRVKAIQDALNGVYYLDDIQIVHLDARMQYGSEDRIAVAVYEIDGSEDEEYNKICAGVGG